MHAFLLAVRFPTRVIIIIPSRVRVHLCNYGSPAQSLELVLYIKERANEKTARAHSYSKYIDWRNGTAKEGKDCGCGVGGLESGEPYHGSWGYFISVHITATVIRQ